jgi:hypothetical protein
MYVFIRRFIKEISPRTNEKFIFLCHFDPPGGRRNLLHIKRFLTRNTGIANDRFM